MEMTPLFGTLKALARILRPEMRKLHAERRAARNSLSVHPENDSLDRHLEDALARLGSIDKNQEFWRKLLTGIGAAYTRPEYFEFPQVRKWLSDDRVKIDYKNLARNRFIGKDVDNNTLDRIREKYTEETGANVHGATYAISVVLAVLHASIRTVLSSGENVTIDIIKDSHTDTVEEIRGHSQEIKNELRRLSPQEDPLHGETLRKDLERIIKQRAIPGINATDEIEALIVRVQDGGSLSRAPMSDKAEAYYWAARILALDEKKADQVRSHLNLYKKILPHHDPSKAVYIEAWLDEAAGRTQDAIKILSALDTSDARTSLLTLLSKRDGNASALDWLANNEPYAHTLLSPAGWRNAAGMMAKEGRWQEAIDLLSNLPEKIFTSFPDLFFVKGLLHASFLLPELIRPRLFGQFYVNFKADAQEGRAATEHRTQAVQAFRQARTLLLELGAEERVHGCEYHLMWIRLTDSQQQDTALGELKEKMKDEAICSIHVGHSAKF